MGPRDVVVRSDVPVASVKSSMVPDLNQIVNILESAVVVDTSDARVSVTSVTGVVGKSAVRPRRLASAAVDADCDVALTSSTGDDVVALSWPGFEKCSDGTLTLAGTLEDRFTRGIGPACTAGTKTGTETTVMGAAWFGTVCGSWGT